MKYLIGSRLVGVNNPDSDYDYVELVNNGGGFYRHLVNISLSLNAHCFYYNREYRERIGRFAIEHDDDYRFIFNVIDHMAGALKVDPFQYMEEWVKHLKKLNVYDEYFYDSNECKYRKRFYNVVFNLECIKKGDTDISPEARMRVKRFHDLIATELEWEAVINEIKELVV